MTKTTRIILLAVTITLAACAPASPTAAPPTPMAVRTATPTMSPAPIQTPTAADIPTVTSTPTATPEPTNTPIPATPTPSVKEYISEEAGIRFEYPSYFELREGPLPEGWLYVFGYGEAIIVITRTMAEGISIEEYTDDVISHFCAEYPPCDVLEREHATLGGETGERILIRYVDTEWRGSGSPFQPIAKVTSTAYGSSRHCQRLIYIGMG